MAGESDFGYENDTMVYGGIVAKAVNDHYATPANQPLTVSAPGVLGNDVGVAKATAIKQRNPVSGTVVLNADGSFTYTPPGGNFSGGEIFTYCIGYTHCDTTAATATVVVGTPSFTMTGTNVTAHEDKAATNVLVAKLATISGSGTITASIDWGDNTSSSGTVTVTGSTGTVKGTHTYTSPGTYTVATTASASTGSIWQATSTASVSAAPPPTLTGVSPPSVVRGASKTLTLTGTGFTGDAKPSFAPGVSITSVTVISTTHVKVKVTVSQSAPTGPGSVLVTTDEGTGTCANCLTVT